MRKWQYYTNEEGDWINVGFERVSVEGLRDEFLKDEVLGVEERGIEVVKDEFLKDEGRSIEGLPLLYAFIAQLTAVAPQYLIPQHLNTSIPQHLNTSTPQHLNTSTPQHLKKTTVQRP